jgi:hypothetical protein
VVSSEPLLASPLLRAQVDDTLPSEHSHCRFELSLYLRQEHSLVCCKHFIFLSARLTTLLAAVIAADRASAAYDIEHTPEKKRQLEREREREALLDTNKTIVQRSKEWAQENRYPLLFGFWIASMAGSWTMVNRNRYLSGSQKLVQARMYAQGATLAALLASFAIEGADAAKGRGRWETVKVLDPNDPEHKHMIEKKIHHESYPGEDQWRGMFPRVSCYFDGTNHALTVGSLRKDFHWVSHEMIALHSN